MHRKRILHLLFTFLLPAALLAQTTTSSMSGTAKTADGSPLIGATITATHEPTGSVYRVQTRAGGVFDISNMNTGGPYTLTGTFVNFQNFTKGEIYLNLGEASRQDIVFVTKSAELGNVTVQGVRKAADFTSKGGTETTIGRDKMENLPTVGRNISDYLRSVPQAKLTAADGGVSIAGQNNRLNSFYIDGAVNNDVFGLAASGTNGGQAGGSPISIDAIDQFQVVISPFDPSIGNFTGGGINAITRSGTNKTQGSIYYIYRNQDFAGKTPTGPKDSAVKLSESYNKTYGFRVGGPIVKNKVFYFINAEIQRDLRPQPFDFRQYRGASNQAAISALIDTIKRKYSYDPGGYLDNFDALDAERIATKIDWNISDKHKLSVSYRYTNLERTNTSASSSTTINFAKNGLFFPSTTNSASAELRSNFGAGKSNRLLLTYTDVNDDRGPINGEAFPRVQIFDGAIGSFVFGPDNSSTINLLRQKNFSFLDRFLINRGRHSYSFGFDNELNNSYNAFIQNTFGNYRYSSLTDFYTNAKPNQYIYGFPTLDSKGDGTASAAAFKTFRLGLFAGDEFKASQNVTLTYGVRADWFKFVTKPITDNYTNDTALPKFAQYYDLQGARSGQRPHIPVSISPRVGVVYKIPEENITIRGGVGLFTGRIPLVWPGGIYNNNGVSQGGYTASATANNAALNTIRFRQDPNNQWKPSEVGINFITKGGLNLITKEFKLPKIFRTSVAVDKRFGTGWTATIEGVFTKNVNEIYYTNINILPPSGKVAGFDNRNLYPASPTIPITLAGTNPYDNAILLSNNKGDKGYAYNFTFTLDKRFSNGFTINANYTYGNSVVVNEATSSVNLSQWRFMETVNGRNNITRSISDFDQGHRIFAYASKRFTYARKSLATTISLVYTGQSGNPYSLLYGGNIVRDDNQNQDLIYIPTAAQLQTMGTNGQFLSNTPVTGGPVYTPAQQVAALEEYISKDKYLRNRRGQYAERNMSRLPFTHLVDLKIAQDFNIKMGKNRYQVQVTYDMFNFTNFLNRDWGRQYFLSNDAFQLINFAGFQTIGGVANTPTYRFNPNLLTSNPYGVSTSLIPNYSARWVSQLGVRLNFN